MNLSDLMKKIEGQEFIANYSILSGFSSVISAMEDDETIDTLSEILENNIDNQLVLLERIYEIIPKYETGYIHPYDIPVTAYLFALQEIASRTILERVVHKVQDIDELWWARKLARIILNTKLTYITHDSDETVSFTSEMGIIQSSGRLFYPIRSNYIEFHQEVSTSLDFIPAQRILNAAYLVSYLQ